MAVQREQPYGGQHFLVDLGDGVMEGPDAAFWAVSGLETWIEAPKYRTGNDRDSSPANLGGLARIGEVTLRRGIIGSLRLHQWFEQLRRGDQGAVRTVTIILLAEDRTPVLTWKLIRARPVRHKWGPFDAAGNEVAMEELAITCEGLEIE